MYNVLLKDEQDLEHINVIEDAGMFYYFYVDFLGMHVLNFNPLIHTYIFYNLMPFCDPFQSMTSLSNVTVFVMWVIIVQHFQRSTNIT